MNKIFTVATSCLALVACGGDEPSSTPNDSPDAGNDVADSGPVTQTASFTLAVQPSAVEVVYGSAVTVTVSVARTGDVGEVAFAVENPPPGITATFTPLGVNDTTSTLTLSVDDLAATGATTLTVVGTSASGERESTPLSVTVRTLAVSGTVSLGTSGIEVVLVDGERTTSTTTGDHGAFSFDDVKPPYDLYAVNHTPPAAPFPGDHVTYYRGLTRPDPTLEVPRMVGGTVLPANTATITGELSGTAVPLSPSTGLFIVWTGSDDSAIKAAPSGATSYTFTPTWLGLSVGKRTGVVHALQLDSSSRAWRGYAKYAVAVDKDETVTADLNMIEPPVVRVSGAITPPVGFAAPEMIFSFHFGERSYPFPKIPISGPVDFPIPVLEDGTVSVQFSSKKDAALSEVIFNDVAAASDVTHQLMDPPTNLSPAANMIASVKDHFTWMAPAGTVSAVEWRVGGVTVTLFTTETDVTLPKVEGVVLSPDNAGWTVHAYGPMTKVDDLAGPTGRKEYKAHSTSGVSPFVLTNSP